MGGFCSKILSHIQVGSHSIDENTSWALTWCDRGCVRQSEAFEASFFICCEAQPHPIGFRNNHFKDGRAETVPWEIIYFHFINRFTEYLKLD